MAPSSSCAFTILGPAGSITIREQRNERLKARENNNPPLYDRTPGKVDRDDQARYAGDNRTENQFADDSKKFGGNCQTVNTLK